MECPKCHAGNADDAVFCSLCFEKFTPPPAVVRPGFKTLNPCGAEHESGYQIQIVHYDHLEYRERERVVGVLMEDAIEKPMIFIGTVRSWREPYAAEAIDDAKRAGIGRNISAGLNVLGISHGLDLSPMENTREAQDAYLVENPDCFTLETTDVGRFLVQEKVFFKHPRAQAMFLWLNAISKFLEANPEVMASVRENAGPRSFWRTALPA